MATADIAGVAQVGKIWAHSFAEAETELNLHWQPAPMVVATMAATADCSMSNDPLRHLMCQAEQHSEYGPSLCPCPLCPRRPIAYLERFDSQLGHKPVFHFI
jgi:hypothetical protein